MGGLWGLLVIVNWVSFGGGEVCVCVCGSGGGEVGCGMCGCVGVWCGEGGGITGGLQICVVLYFAVNSTLPAPECSIRLLLIVLFGDLLLNLGRWSGYSEVFIPGVGVY